MKRNGRLVCALVAGALGLAACVPASASPGTRELSAGEVFEAAKPAVVIVETVAAVTWSVPQPEIDPKKQSQLNDRLAALVRSGNIAPTQAAVNRAELQIVTDDPNAWFSLTGPSRQYTDTDYFTGSGFFITEDGYLLTNAHVVQASQDEVKRMLIAGLRSQAAGHAFIQSVRDSLSKAFETQVSDQQAEKLAVWLASAYASSVQLISVSPSYRIAFGSHSPKDVQDHGLPVRLVVHGDAVPGKDVAVLKAEGGPYETVPLATQPPHQGSRLHVVGYPCGCQGEDDFDPEKTLAPSLSQGAVVTEIAMPGGWRATGTNATMQHGNSGGPVMDGAGRVIGLATFQDVAASSSASQTYNFVVPVDVAREFTSQVGVRPAQGQLGRKYTQAIAEFEQRHYRAALPLFEMVASADSRNPYAATYVEQTRSAIAAGRDRTPPPPPEYLRWLQAYGPYLLVAGSVLALGAGGAALVLRRRNRRGAAL